MIYALIVADLLMIGTFLFRFSSVPQQIPLYYSRAWGADQLADYWYIFLLPALLHIFIFFNIFLYNRYFFPDSTLRKMLDYLSWLYIGGFTGIFLKIILLVT